MQNIIGIRIKKLRLDNKESQEELGILIGITTSAIGMIERGNRNPSYDVLIKIADHYNVSTDYLLGRIEEKAIDPNHIYVAIDNELMNKAIVKIKRELKEKIIKILEE